MICSPSRAKVLPLAVWAAQVSITFQILDTDRTQSVILAKPFVLRLDSTCDGVANPANCAPETSHCVPVTPRSDMVLSELVRGKTACPAEVSKVWKMLDTQTVQTRNAPANMSNCVDRVSDIGTMLSFVQWTERRPVAEERGVCAASIHQSNVRIEVRQHLACGRDAFHPRP